VKNINIDKISAANTSVDMIVDEAIILANRDRISVELAIQFVCNCKVGTRKASVIAAAKNHLLSRNSGKVDHSGQKVLSLFG
jgi:hypothetical protein